MNVILNNQPPIQPLNFSSESPRVAYTNPSLGLQNDGTTEVVGELIVKSIIKGTLFSHDHREPWFGSMDGLVVGYEGPIDPIKVGRHNLLTYTDQEIVRELGYLLKDNFKILKYMKQISNLRKSKVKRAIRRCYMVAEDVIHFFYIIIG